METTWFDSLGLPGRPDLARDENRERNLNRRESELEKRDARLGEMEQEWALELQQVAQMSEEEAQKIRAETDKEVRLTLADAYEKAQSARGRGDAESKRRRS